MDKTREKLIELEREATDHASDICIDHRDCEDCPGRKYGIHCRDYLKADNLISNGVTVQKWIPVTERLPKNDYGKHWKERKHYLVSLAPSGLMCVAHYGYKEYDWWIDEHDCVLSATNFKEVTHWMEINNFPPPPKGE